MCQDLWEVMCVWNSWVCLSFVGVGLWLQKGRNCVFFPQTSLLKYSPIFLIWQFSQQLSEKPILLPTVLSSIFHSHIDPSLSLRFIFSTTWTSPVPSLHPSLTSHMPPTRPPCQLTPEHGHIVLPFDPLPACRSTQDPRPAVSVLVCHRALSPRSVIDGSWWEALTHRAAALTRMVWGSIDYDAAHDRGESGLSWWWQGEDKRGRGYGWGAVS